MKLLRVGFGNAVVASRIRQIVGLKSAAEKRLRHQAGELRRLIDATAGRHTRSMILTDSGHIILSAIRPHVLEQKLHESTSLTKE